MKNSGAVELYKHAMFLVILEFAILTMGIFFRDMVDGNIRVLAITAWVFLIKTGVDLIAVDRRERERLFVRYHEPFILWAAFFRSSYRKYFQTQLYGWMMLQMAILVLVSYSVLFLGMSGKLGWTLIGSSFAISLRLLWDNHHVALKPLTTQE